MRSCLAKLWREWPISDAFKATIRCFGGDDVEIVLGVP
jgi:hypothetical protein